MTSSGLSALSKIGNSKSQEGILDRWILPENGLNAGTIYEGRPVGNCTEIMPLDCNLNKDCHEGAKRHRLYSNRLDKDDPRKFGLRRPKQGSDTYRRLWDPSLHPDGIPSSKRIIEEVNKILDETLLKVINARGAAIPGLGS